MASTERMEVSDILVHWYKKKNKFKKTQTYTQTVFLVHINETEVALKTSKNFPLLWHVVTWTYAFVTSDFSNEVYVCFACK